jgi:hypothetical protein
MQQEGMADDGKPVSKHGAAVQSRALKWLGWFMHLLIILVCITPSVWVNVDAVLRQEAGLSDIACVVGFAIAAAICTLFVFEAAWRRLYGWSIAMVPLALFFIVLNWGIAMGGFSVVHEATRDMRAEQIRQREESSARAKENSAKIEALRKVAGYDTPGMIEAEVLRLKRDRHRAAGSLEREMGRLDASRQIVRLETERAAKGWAVSTATEQTVQQSADPMISNLTNLSLVLLNIDASPKVMGAIWASLKALGTELLADALPPVIVLLLRLLKGEGRPARASRARRAVTPEKAVTPSPSLPVTQPITEALSPITMTPENSMLSIENQPVTEGITARVSPAVLDRHDTLSMVTPAATPKTPRKTHEKKVSKKGDPASLGDVAQWVEDNLEFVEGEKIQATPLHQHYVEWCEARGKTPVNMYGFGLTLKELQKWPKEQIGGRWFYMGASLKKKAFKVVQ